jgi:hypothetical protein
MLICGCKFMFRVQGISQDKRQKEKDKSKGAGQRHFVIIERG